LQDDQLNGADRKKYATIIFDETQRLTRLLDDLLDLAVLENGQVALDIQTGSLASVLDRAVSASNVAGQLRIRRNASS
ncbi:MAG: hypothetical protein ACPGRD_03260, partial [Planktomarina sp.]